MKSPTGPSRSWCDDDLRRAVAAERSWRGTARALGLEGTSSGSIRGLKLHAKRLHLDTSHFTHQRRWSDHQLREALVGAATWSDVLRALELTDRADTRLRVKGHAVRMGLDISHLARRRFDSRAAELRDSQPKVTLLWAAAESIAIAWFAVRAVAVALPAQPCAYDLLVTLPSGVQRVQVKSTTHRGRYGTWTVALGQRPYALDKTASRSPYDPDTIDYFFVVDGDGALYLIPSPVVAGRIAINVGAYEAYRVGDASSLLATSDQIKPPSQAP